MGALERPFAGVCRQHDQATEVLLGLHTHEFFGVELNVHFGRMNDHTFHTGIALRAGGPQCSENLLSCSAHVLVLNLCPLQYGLPRVLSTAEYGTWRSGVSRSG